MHVQEPGVFRVVGQEEEDEHADKDGDASVDDEDVAPDRQLPVDMSDCVSTLVPFRQEVSTHSHTTGYRQRCPRTCCTTSPS